MWSKEFWASTAERALKTFAQALIAVFIGGVTLISVNWTDALAVAGTATAISVLTSIVSAGVGPDGSPSLVGEPPKVDGTN